MKEIEERFFKFGQGYQIGLREPQAGNLPKILAYANAVYVQMFKFVINAIIDERLPFKSSYEQLEKEMLQIMQKGRGSEINPMDYFLMKVRRTKDIKTGWKYALEKVEDYTDFDDYLPIVDPLKPEME